MLEDRDYLRQPVGGFRVSATVVLLAINALIYLCQATLLNEKFVDEHLALSLYGLHHGFYWQFFTYQFLHAGLPHLLVNSWALYVFGRDVEYVLGVPRFLILYFLSGVIGGVFQEFVALIWPYYFGSAVVGASAGIFGVVSAFALLFPERPLVLLLFLVIPFRMRAKFLLLINLLLTAAGIASPQFHLTFLNKIFGHVAHAAHLGGILTGLAFIRIWERFRRHT